MSSTNLANVVLEEKRESEKLLQEGTGTRNNSFVVVKLRVLQIWDDPSIEIQPQISWNEHVQISDYIKLPQFWAFEQSPRHWLMSSPTRPLTDIYTMFLIAWIWMFGSQTRRFEKPWRRCLPQTTTISYPPPKSWICEISQKLRISPTKGVPPINFMSGADARADTQPGASKVLRASIHSCRRSWPQMLSFWVGDQRESSSMVFPSPRYNCITAIEIVVSPCHVGNVISPTSKSA